MNQDRIIERLDRENRRKVMQTARRRAAANTRSGVNSRNREALTYAGQLVPEGWR